MDSRDVDRWDTSHEEQRAHLRLRTFRQRAGSVSHALWPAHMRRSVATGRVAQGRRRLLLYSRWGPFLVSCFRWGTPLLMIAISMVVGGTIVAALLLHTWYILIVAGLLLTFMTLLIIPPSVLKLSHMLHLPEGQPIRPLRSGSIFPGARREPETPLPTAPLVRVLETYDLSETEVQHFVGAQPPERDTAELRLNLRQKSVVDQETVIDDT
ncbi:MAG: hypothetical protein ACJ8AG_07675 [Ktedonobacteraceae bacterium]